MRRYKVKKGKQAFRPSVSFCPRWAMGFELTSRLTPSCWWSAEDWQGDADRSDWNKLGGMTFALSRNNRTAALIAWRPADLRNTFLITGYTNDSKGGWQVGAESIGYLVVSAGDTFTCTARLEQSMVATHVRYEIQNDTGESIWFYHQFDSPILPLYRQVCAWIGGANNAPGDYGGEAHKRMVLYKDFKFT